jgi:cardiolipin synthase A/B
MILTLTVGIAAGAGLVWLISHHRDSRVVLHPIENCPAPGDPRFARSVGPLLGSSFIPGNRVEILRNGDAIFPSMLEAIRAARRTICFETFIYWSGEIGSAFADAFIERAKAGVKVYVLLDYVGSSRMSTELVDRMQEAGCRIERFHPPHLLHPSRINNRTHRKLLVVDGRVGFTGGVGISDKWRGQAQDPDHWRDTHFRITGPAITQMQAVFMVNWIKTVGRVETSEDFFPELEPEGTTAAQLFHSSPEDGRENVRLMFLIGIQSARKSICLTQAYFLPDKQCRRALIDAAARGVRVQVIAPGPLTDSAAVRWASRSTWGELLRGGVHIHEYQPTTLHTKCIVVDGTWCSVGSANFDPRSFRLNDEANLNLIDPVIAKSLGQHFEHDLTQSRRVTLESWCARSLGERILAWFCRRVRRLL